MKFLCLKSFQEIVQLLNIIKLFDSEVDLERKAIFLVMEVGNGDLNNVLKQHAD